MNLHLSWWSIPWINLATSEIFTDYLGIMFVFCLDPSDFSYFKLILKSLFWFHALSFCHLENQYSVINEHWSPMIYAVLSWHSCTRGLFEYSDHRLDQLMSILMMGIHIMMIWHHYIEAAPALYPWQVRVTAIDVSACLCCYCDLSPPPLCA